MATNLTAPLFNKGINKNIGLSLDIWNPEWKEVFHVRDTTDRTVWDQGWAGYTLPQRRYYGGAIFQSSFQYDYSKQYIMQSFGLGDSIPMEDIKDDMYGVFHRALAMKGGLIGQTFMDLVDVTLGNYLGIQGYASGSTTYGTVDGLSICNTAHPVSSNAASPTFSNRPSADADFSITTYQIANTTLMQQKAPNNITILRDSVKTLMINPNLRYIAAQVLKSGWYPNTADRDVNYSDRDGVKIVEWPYFAAGGTVGGPLGANNAWMCFGKNHHLNYILRDAPDAQTDYSINTNSQIIAVTMRFDYGTSSARAIYGSNGH